MAKKLKGKEWYTLIAPKFFKEKVIGETPTGDAKGLIGRKIDVHLINLVEDLSKYYVKFYFKINKIKDDKAHTDFFGLECMRDYISRLIRYGITRIDTVQNLTTKDNKNIVIKSIIITSKKIKKNVEIDLKNFIQDKIKKEVESSTLDELIEKAINDRIKNSVFKDGKKIYPIRAFEIRKMENKSISTS